jgi:signal transduction histidine kinase
MRLFETQDLGDNLDQLQNRISLLFALLAGFLMIFLGVSDLIMGLDPFIIKAKFIYSIPYLAGFWIMRKYGYHQPVIQFLICAGLVLVAFNYVYNEGYQGPTLYTVFIFVVGIGILIKGWPKIAWLLIVFTLYTLLFYGEVQGWFLVPQNYSGLESLYWDHLVTIWWTGIFSFLGIQIFLRNYRSQTDSLRLIQAERELAMKELDSLNTKKNQLIALLSHDLKNPIGMLGQTLELADKGLFEEGEMEGILKNLKNQSYHLSAVLNNTLNWVLAELEDKELETEKVSIYKFTDEMKNGMLSQAAIKNQTIDFKKIGNDLNIELETSEIQIILKNLLDNAIKFTPVGGEIEFELICSEKNVKWIVKNEGKEIPEREVNTLFDFKVKTTYGTLREKGTGIGLPLCKKIADKLAMDLGYSRTETGKNSFYLTKNLT